LGQRAFSQTVSNRNSFNTSDVKYPPLPLGTARFSQRGKRPARDEEPSPWFAEEGSCMTGNCDMRHRFRNDHPREPFHPTPSAEDSPVRVEFSGSFGYSQRPMNRKKNKPQPASPSTGEAPPKIISENRKARHRYEILEQLECGMILTGSEVKSLREGKVSLDEAYVRMREGNLWLVGSDIPPYRQATLWNHDPKRPRKLLVHKRQLLKLAGRVQEKGLTLIPLGIYFNPRGLVKLTVGVCRGKKLHDKRQSMKEADARRQISRATRRR
jgi:SsrA-binding protein